MEGVSEREKKIPKIPKFHIEEGKIRWGSLFEVEMLVAL